MATLHDIEIDIHASVGIVRPGDKLVVAVSSLDMAARDKLREQLGQQLPGVEVIPVQASALIVYRQ